MSASDDTRLSCAELLLRMQALDHSAKYLASILRAAPMGVGVLKDRVFLEVNDAMTAMTGYRREELVGQPTRMLYPTQADYDYVGTEKYRQIGASGIGRVDTRWRRKDGAIVEVCLSSTYMSPESCAVCVVFTAEDISWRKRSEDALQRSEALAHATLQALPAHVAVVDGEGRIVAVNQAWVEFARANGAAESPAVVVGAHYLEIVRRAAEHDDARAASALSGIEAVLKGTLSRFGMEYPCHGPREQRWFFMSVVPLGASAGGGLVITHIDVTDRKLAVIALREQEARQRDVLVREVHHRIKNHLQGVTGLLRNRAAEKPEIAAALDEAIGQINIVAQVFGLQGRADVERVRLCDLVRMAAEGAAGAVVAVDCQLAPPGRTAPLAQEEAVPVALVVNELIVNAVKHLDPPDPDRPVRVSVDVGAVAVTVTIRSAPARLPADFDFATGRVCGTGLGLVRALLPRQGATLTFRQDGDAVVTTLRLASPVVRLADAAEREREAARRRVTGDAGSPPPDRPA